jgi:hypothetical protein
MNDLKLFAYDHLPAHLQEVSKIFYDAAAKVLELQAGAERSTAMRKLLEAKDCAVRAKLFPGA